MDTVLFMILLQPGFSTKVADTGVVEQQIRRLITCGLQANEVLVPEFCYEYLILRKFSFDVNVL